MSGPLDALACTGSRRALEKSVEELPPNVVVQLARHCARRVAGRSPTLVDSRRRSRTRSPRTERGGASLPGRARHRDRARSARRRACRPAGPPRRRAAPRRRYAGTRHARRRRATRATQRRARGAGRAAFAADRGFMRLDNGAPEYLATVEAALAVTDPADVATYARLRALLARSLMYTPDAAAFGRRARGARARHRARRPDTARAGRTGGALRAMGTGTA